VPPTTRGRIPGPVRGESYPPGGSPRQRGARRQGPLGGPGRVLLAEQERVPQDTASDAVPAAGRQMTEPDPLSSDIASLRDFQLVLFGASGAPLPEEVIQGNVNACPLAAALVALAHTRAAALQGMVTAVQAAIQSRALGDPAGQYPHSAGRLIAVQFPGGSRTEVSSLLWMTGGRIAYCHSTTNTGWMCYIEKAYAVWRGRNAYDNLNRIGTGAADRESDYTPPDTRQVFMDLAGRCVMAHLEAGTLYEADDSAHRLTAAGLRELLNRSGNRPTIAASRADTNGRNGIEASHSYAVMGLEEQVIHLRNPRGGEAAGVDIRLPLFAERFAAVLQSSG